MSGKLANRKYDHRKVEKKWQERWEKDGLYCPDIEKTSKADKFYNLWMFPYPSAEGLHVGHAFTSTGSDIYGRFMRMNGKTLFQPTGYDAFGIHSENYALKISENPHNVVERTTGYYTRQLKSLGHSYDWTRTVTTSNIDYYKWTEWLFAELFKAGLAYRKKQRVNFCPSCKTVLADEQVMTPKQAGKEAKDSKGKVIKGDDLRVCERCGTLVEDKNLEQWFFRITDYADRLLNNLEKINWTEKVKVAQKEWIGKSKGLSINFSVEGLEKSITVWTKFWETVFGTTFLVVAPEYANKYLLKLIPNKFKKDVTEYIKVSLKKSDKERSEIREKSGVLMGITATNLVNGKKVPIYVADYVLTGVGTGAVMGVPAHDERDFEFAKKNNLNIIQVVSYEDGEINKKVAAKEMSHEGEGKIVNSGQFDGLDAWGEGKKKMAEWMIEKGIGRWEINYHLRDWLISRQRYWGCPTPMIYCETCAKKGFGYLSENKKKLLHKDQNDWESEGWWPEDKLPVELPHIKDWKPEGTGKGPLANHPEYYKIKCPYCGSEAKRETDVCDTFLDSSWYFLRYPSVGAKSKDKLPFDPEISNNWLPVDLYFGGAEHAVLHLMYSRFITMVLHDLKYLNFEEPFPKFKANGLVIKDGAKMSKSRGNVVNPDKYVEKYGADTLRMYLVFMGPMDGYSDFRDTGIEGMGRFIGKLWNMFSKVTEKENKDNQITSKLHHTIKKVTEDVGELKYNTALSTIMEYVNLLNERRNYSHSYLEPLIKMVAPFAPHFAEEIWSEIFDKKKSIHLSDWPKFDKSKLVSDIVTIAVQVNGKLRSTFEIETEVVKDKEKILDKAKNDEKVSKWFEGKKVIKEIFVPGKLVNFVVK